MKRKELDQFKLKTPEELKKFAEESKEKLRALKFDLAAGKVKNVSELRNVRRNIARALTLLAKSKTQGANGKTANGK